ncbi:MAG: sulfopyruvate decarboxylase subunit beta [Methanotrichaceae archaeon]
MKRIEAISAIAEEVKSQGALLIGNIGFPSKELYAVHDSSSNFYMLGSMGLASSIGLGLALARKDKKVISLDGDGSVLMNLGTLATIADQDPENYLLVILDNGCYGSTGCQPTCTCRKANLAEIAKGAGISGVKIATTPEELRESVHGKGVIVAKVESGNAEVPVIDLMPKQIIDRFMDRCARPSL